MLSNSIYLFDSDVLIDAKNHYYNPAYAGMFWSWLLEGINHGIFRTVKQVKKEFLDGNDGCYLKEIIAKDEKYAAFWCDTEIKEIWDGYGKLMNWANTEWIKGKDKIKVEIAVKTFATENKADAWLVAWASSTQSFGRKKVYIVTNEKSAPDATNSVKLPDAARSQGVEVMQLFKLLSKYSGANFRFKI